MADVSLVDVSIRDGNQSLWSATGLSTSQILAIAPVLDRAGFRAIDFISSTAMGVAVRTHREDPWQRIARAREAMPHTPLQIIGTGLRFISWELAHPELMQLVYDRLVANGISRFVVLDPMHDLAAIRDTARRIRRAGADEIMAALTYTISDVHDDAFYADLASAFAACDDIDRAYIKDPTGLLTPERAATLIPAVRDALGSKALELHSHCTLGLSPLTYLAAAELGVDALHVACGPLASGSSLPSAQRTIANLAETGRGVAVDRRLVDRVADYFARLADAEGLPAGQPQEFDASFQRHQLAGGVMTTLRRQLAELGLAHRFDDVIAEVGVVRAELGHPIMVTPFPQMVCSQALLNVIGEQRYGNVPDQVIRYVLGRFGRPTSPVDPEVEAAILSRARAEELRAEPGPAHPDELRERLPAGISDEELLLRATMPAEQVDAMRAAPPAASRYNPDLAGVADLLAGLGRRGGVGELSVARPGWRVTVRGGAPEQGRPAGPAGSAGVAGAPGAAP